MKPLHVVIRTDASTTIGTGHLMRCLTLANPLLERGASVSLICRSLPDSMVSLVEGKGLGVHLLPEVQAIAAPADLHFASKEADVFAWEDDAEKSMGILAAKEFDLLIVDHYLLDRCWEERMRPYVKGVMVIDDLANRPHDCDLLLDQNLYENLESRYGRLVPGKCRQLLGPRFALLRSEFQEAKRSLRERDGIVRRVMVFFGGSDPTNETAKALEALLMVNRPDIAIDVVVGGANPHREQVAGLCARMPNVTLHGQVDTMAQLMAAADLAVGAGGTATWERCFLGLPSLTVIVADNQVEVTQMLGRAGAIWNVGWHEDVTAVDLASALEATLRDPDELRRKGRTAIDLMGGASYRGADGVMEALLEVIHESV